MIPIMEKRPYIGVSTLFVGLAKLLKAVAHRGAFSFATQNFREISLFILYLASSWIVIAVIVCATSVLLAGGGVVWGHIVNFTLISNICFSCRRSIRLAAPIKLNPHLTPHQHKHTFCSDTF